MTEFNEFDPAERKGAIQNTVVIIVVFMVVVVGLFVNKVLQPRILSPKEMVNAGAVIFSVPREISDFSLVDKNEQNFTKESLKGKWTLVFFGFTYCPDICPATLAILNEVTRNLADTQYTDSTDVLLVSLDPARDTPEVMKRYVDYFNPEFNGITGEFLVLRKLANQLNTAFRKVVTDSETGDYTIDHGGNIAIVNPDGHYAGFYKPPLDVARITLTYKSLRMSQE